MNDSNSGTNGATDRDFINKLKEDTSGRNHFYKKFEELIDKVGKEGIAFRTDLELLHYALDRANLKPERISSCSLRSAVVNYQDKDNPIDLIKSPRINQDLGGKSIKGPLSNMLTVPVILYIVHIITFKSI